MKDSLAHSIFPFYQFYAFDNDNLHSFECIKKRIFTPKNRFYQHKIKNNIDDSINKIELFTTQNNLFKEDLLQVINNLNSSQLSFEILLSRILLLIFNPEIDKFKLEEITSNFISNKKEFVNLLNYRIDLIKIEELLKDYENNLYIKIDPKKFLNEIIIYTYKFIFLKLSETYYYSHSPNIQKLNKTINFKELYKTFKEFSIAIEKGNFTMHNIDFMNDFIVKFFNSFKTNDLDLIEKAIEELNQFSNFKLSKNRLINIIDYNIKIDSTLSSTQKNRLLFPFFKYITIVLIHREYLDLEERELKNKFRKFQNSKNNLFTK